MRCAAFSLGATCGDGTQGHPLHDRRRYRASQWFVAIYPGGVEVERRRVSGDRQDAETRARAMIKRWLKLNGAQRSPGGSSTNRPRPLSGIQTFCVAIGCANIEQHDGLKRMCGRFTYKLTWSELVRLYRLSLDQPPRNTQARYNVCSTDHDSTQSSPMRTSVNLCRCGGGWCHVGGARRSKTQRWRRSTREPRRSRQAILPRRFQAHTLPDPGVGLLRVAGRAGWKATLVLHCARWVTCVDRSGLVGPVARQSKRRKLKSCTMIITEPNSFVAEVHDRMPALLAEKDFEPWLPVRRCRLLKPASEDTLQRWPVSKRVNSSKAPADDPTLIERVRPRKAQVS